MTPSVEQTFREADRVARQLGDMKHSIYEVRVHGGISESDRLDALDGFITHAYEMLAGLRKKIEHARKEAGHE